MAATVDTHREVKKLVDAGLEEPQAEAVVETVLAGREGLATDAKVELLGTSLRAEMAHLNTSLRAEMELLRTTLRGDMKDLKLDLIKWLGGMMIALIGIAVAALSLILGG